MSKNGNKQLGEAKKNKKDEFYTQLSDIERELRIKLIFLRLSCSA